MAEDGAADWLGTTRRIADLWLALQLTVGIALSVAVGAVTDSLTSLTLAVLIAIPLLLAVAVVLTGRSLETEPFWAGGLAILGAAIGLAFLSYVFDVSAPEHVLYLLSVAVVLGSYTVYRALKFLARSTTPQ